MSTFVLITISGLGVGGLYFLLASGLSLIFGLMRILSFAHGAFLSVSAFTAWGVLRSFDSGSTTGLLLGLVVAAAVGGVLAFVTEILVIRRLAGRELEQLLATVGIGIATVALLQSIFGPDERLVELPGWLTSVTNVGGAAVPNNRFLAIAAAVVVMVAILAFLRRTRHGLVIRAGVENREMVQALGIDDRRSFTLVFTLGGVAAGFAGGLAAIYYRSVSPSMGDEVLIFSFIVLIVGGLGSIVGAGLAAALIGWVQISGNYYLYNGVGDVLVFVLLAAMLLVRPQGIFGRKARLA